MGYAAVVVSTWKILFFNLNAYQLGFVDPLAESEMDFRLTENWYCHSELHLFMFVSPHTGKSNVGASFGSSLWAAAMPCRLIIQVTDWGKMFFPSV